MDVLSRIATWLSNHEAAISAVAAIIVISGVVLAGVRWLLLRGAGEALKKGPAPLSRKTILIAAGAGALIMLAGAAAWLILPDEPATEIVSEEDRLLALPTGPVVAVLPFENLSEDPSQEYFSDGLADGIITALSRFRDLFVIARNSTFRYKNQAVDVRQLRGDLGADYVLEGSVQKAGTTLRVTVQLLDAEDGTHLWADTYDRELSASNIFAVQDEISERVVATIGSVYGVISRARFAEVKDTPTDQLDAYECVLQWGAYDRGPHSAGEHRRVGDCLERAVKSDPNYAEAWAGLSWIYLDEYRYNYNLRPDSLDRTLDAARRAVASDPTSQRAHEALAAAYFYRKEFDRFFAEAERTIELNPSDTLALASIGDQLRTVGDERGIILVKKAIKLDPFHPPWFYFPIVAFHFDRGEYEDALTAALKIDIPGLIWPHVYLAAIYAELGREEEARSAVDDVLKLDPGYRVQKYIEEERKFNFSEQSIRRWAAALRKAGLPE